MGALGAASLAPEPRKLLPASEAPSWLLALLSPFMAKLLFAGNPQVQQCCSGTSRSLGWEQRLSGRGPVLPGEEMLVGALSSTGTVLSLLLQGVQEGGGAKVGIPKLQLLPAYMTFSEVKLGMSINKTKNMFLVVTEQGCKQCAKML